MYLNDNGKWVGVWKMHPEDTPIITKEFIYLFTDLESGEDFIVQVAISWNFLEENDPEPLDAAYEIAKKYFNEVDWIKSLTEEEAEALGLDTYTE